MNAKMMSQLAMVSIALGAGCASEALEAEDDVEELSSNVVAGDSVSEHLRKNSAFLYRADGHVCSSTVIDPKRGWVLTAAHCVFVTPSIRASGVLPPSNLLISQSVSPGMDPAAAPKQSVYTVVVHPSLDVALLGIASSDVSTSNSLWLAPPSALEGKILECYGYGKYEYVVGEDPAGCGYLRSARLMVKDSVSPYYIVEKNTRGQFLTFGDSGGSCFRNKTYSGDEYAYVITGVHSAGASGETYDLAVSSFATWLAATVGGFYIHRLYDQVSGHQYMDVQWGGTASGTTVWTWSWNGGAAQLWTYDPSTKEIKNVNSGKCLDVQWSGTANGTPVWIYDCNGSAAQKWDFTDSMQIKNANGRCLDIPDGSFSTGLPLQIWECANTSGQRWAISPSAT